ncbi:MAG TPA: M3 family metallopeptidase [Allosphingosinicella sp.]|nr:M3 family metallopeptidase [Allosphingosinicella sp.]
MHKTRKLIAFILVTAAAPALAAGYTPVSDAALGPILAKPRSAAEVTAMCDRRIAAIGSLQSKVEAMPLTTAPATLLAAYDDLYNLAVTAAFAEPPLIKDTNPDAAIRTAAEECVQKTNQVVTRFQMSRPVYERLQAVERAGVAPELRYTLARQLDNFRRAGVARDEATRKRIEALQNEITQTGIEFDRNINANHPVVKAKPEELAGVPQDYLDRHKPGADGMVEIKMTGADIAPILQYADSAALRKRVQTAWLNRAYPANDAVLKKLFAQRAELASLLGYPNFAAYDLANRMARDPVRTRAFVDQIAAAARPVGEKEAARLLARLRKDDPRLAGLSASDAGYAMRLVRKETFDVDPAVVRTYFSFDKVRSGIFSLTQDLFGVQIRPWTTEVWSPEVKAYELVEKGQVIGRFYLDMHPRDNKYTHAAMFPVRIGIKGRVLPAAALITNFPEGLMEHGQVETFLHEFGHLLHWLFAGQREYAMQNFGEIENDVIEAPSTLLEEWVWDADTLAKFATDAQGRPIPRALVDKMVAGRNFGRAFGTMGQLGLASVALDYYSSPMGEVDLIRRFNETYGRYALAPFPEGSHMHASFGHLSGYGASYYTYQWSEALAADLLSRFRRAGLRDAATARAYRELILAPGGSASMNDLAKSFLGRDWSVDAYRRELEGGGE